MMPRTAEGINKRAEELRVMILKIILNLRNRMEAGIKKIQAMFQKDLE